MKHQSPSGHSTSGKRNRQGASPKQDRQTVRATRASEPAKSTDSRKKPDSQRQKIGRSKTSRSGIKEKILASLKERPLDKVEISKAIDVPAAERSNLREVLRQMEVDGQIARIRKDRYVLPEEADLFTGVIQFHVNGAAHILSEKDGETDLYISAENTFTAMHGDRVVARISTGPAGKPRPGEIARKEGRVIRILTRANETIVGTLQKSKNFFYVVADDPRFVHNLYVAPPEPGLGARVGDKVVAHMDLWPTRHVNPEGHVVEVLGAVGAPGVDMLSIIRKHNLPTGFPEEVLREVEGISPEVRQGEISSREDLRQDFQFTIDPDDAKDFDDAISVKKVSGGWLVGVHIADVSHYVRPGTAIDREATHRGNSVYLVDRVIPMLPEALSNGICSLKPGVDRMAFTVFAEITKEGKVRRHRFAKSVIRSAARLTYKQAFEILRRPAGDDEVSQKVHLAWAVSSLLRKRRFAAGSLDLDFPEVKVWLDKQGRPDRIEKVDNDISHQLIEELMLLANELVAKELKLRRQPAVYRVHEKPDPDRLEDFREFAASQGVRAGDLTNRDELKKLLAGIRGKPIESPVKIALLKSLKRATYSPDPLGHYGLSKSDYTHFTSPIRRYSDLIVHRALERLLGITRTGPDASVLKGLSAHISATERVAADAERESVRLKKLEYFERQIGRRSREAFRAMILEVRNFGIFVELPDFLQSGLIHVSSLDGDFFVLDPARGRLVGRRTKKTYQVGDVIQVVVARVDKFKQQVDFAVAE